MLASRPSSILASRDGWTNPTDLCECNFGTCNPKEINWYPEKFVGCTVSHDGKNYFFSSDDGITSVDKT